MNKTYNISTTILVPEKVKISIRPCEHKPNKDLTTIEFIGPQDSMSNSTERPIPNRSRKSLPKVIGISFNEQSRILRLTLTTMNKNETSLNILKANFESIIKGLLKKYEHIFTLENPKHFVHKTDKFIIVSLEHKKFYIQLSHWAPINPQSKTTFEVLDEKNIKISSCLESSVKKEVNRLKSQIK